MVAGLVLAAVCVIAPQQLKAEVPAAQMDGVMGQSIKDETVYEETPNLDALIMQGATATYSLPTMRAATGSSYSQDFLDSSFTTAGTYTSTTYYHKADSASAFNPVVLIAVSLYQKFASRFPAYPLTLEIEEYCQKS